MIDERLITELELLKTDLTVISQKLESKSQAVIILHEALEKCEKERDEFKRMAEQVMGRYQLLRKTVCQDTPVEVHSVKGLGHLDRKQLASLLVESHEANKGLQQELVEMKVKLSEALGDIKLLRKQLKSPVFGPPITQKTELDEKEKWVLQMEKLTERVNELERELARCCDDKQELVTERDIYRNKCDRLNNELNYILNGDDRKIVDIDTLIMEKRLLNSRLRALEEEKRLAMATLTKYQRMMERKASKTSSVGSDCPFTPCESPNHQTFEPTSEAIQVAATTDPVGRHENPNFVADRSEER
ncbi:Coiled-coil domain-containing protein 149 [Clonorchis sinensis]|uniref:Coiled-coil domain-containing protein 149 n=1 Tax=Clonorchis sinensis TaxID=79923 RepID=A0A8T1MH87_CLOSI|nr:Coiled-coil domain-containing protein 149 [Clonorchis sinensis]